MNNNLGASSFHTQNIIMTKNPKLIITINVLLRPIKRRALLRFMNLETFRKETARKAAFIRHNDIFMNIDEVSVRQTKSIPAARRFKSAILYIDR
jgi:hypothetical protein